MRYLLDTSIFIAAMKGVAAVRGRLASVLLGADAARHYAAIRAELERLGTPIGANDYWIAAQGLALDAVVVTDDANEFSRVQGPAVENWLAARQTALSRGQGPSV